MTSVQPERARGWVLDVDGCLMRTARAGGSGGAAMPKAAEFIESITRDGSRVLICTNASERPPAEYVTHLQESGLPISADQFVTAGGAAAEYIARHHPDTRILVLGSEGISQPLIDRGCYVFQPGVDEGLADVVVVGGARAYLTADLNAACMSVDGGAPLYVTVASPWFHGGIGKSVSSSSAIAAAVAWVTGVEPIVLGKPSPALASTLLELLGLPADQVSVVGDATAEIELARHMGAKSILVLSGATTADEAGTFTGDAAPDLILDDIASLHDLRQSLEVKENTHV